MNYHEALEKIGNKCPFCNMDEKLKIYDYATAYMTIAMAPYGLDHILVIPKRHVDSIFDLNVEESDEIRGLVEAGMNILKRKGYTDLSILVREGMASGKSIPHLHYHIIPNIQIGATTSNGDRKFLDEKESGEILENLRKFKV